MHSHTRRGRRARRVHHETSDVNIRGVFGFGVGLVVVGARHPLHRLAAVHVLRRRESVAGDAAVSARRRQEHRLPPEPRLQTNPREDLRDLRGERGRDCSNGYGWVDKNAGVVRIPIDEAMKLTLSADCRRGRQVNAMTRHDGHDGTISSPWSCALCPCVSFVSSASQAHAQMTGAPATPATSASRDIGVVRDSGAAARDRLRSEPRSARAARHDVPRRGGPHGAPRRLLRQAAGRAGVRVLRLPDAVHAGDQRPGERARRAVARTRARTSRSSPSASIRATRRRRPPRRRRSTSQRYQQPGRRGGWHFLTGEQASIDRLTKAAGFRYVWDEETKQFAHPTGVIVLTPDGRLARYLFGIEYGPRDLRSRSSKPRRARSATPVDALLLYCYHYDPMTGRYGLAHHARDAHRGRRHRARARRVHRRHGAPRETASAAPSPHPGSRGSRLANVVRHSALPRTRVDDGRRVDALYFFLLAVARVLLAADRRPDRLLRVQVPPPRRPTASASAIHGGLTLEIDLDGHPVRSSRW